MRVLVDTSVWSLALRKKGPADHPQVHKLTKLLGEDGDVALTGLILQEVLQAFRSEATFQQMEEMLSTIPLLDLTRQSYVGAATLHRKCAARGYAVSTTDCQIASAAIEHGCLLLTDDEDFERIASVSALELA